MDIKMSKQTVIDFVSIIFIIAIGFFIVRTKPGLIGVILKNFPNHSSITPIPTEKVETTLLTEDLKVGSSGDDVIILQSALTTNNLLPKNLVTGYFGAQTQNAVISFQKENNILQSGELDSVTRNRFNKVFGETFDRQYYLSLVPTVVPVPTAIQNSINNDDGKWGVAEREAGTQYGWSMNVGDDPVMASAQEVFDALNNYRSKKGTHGLNWDGNLASYAQERATFIQANGLDDHAGFKNYISDVDNRRKLGFLGLGENASTGYRMTGTHIIEWIFASDQPHDSNQLDSSWTDVGIGVSGTSVDIIFGYDRF